MSRKFSDMDDKEFDDFIRNLSESPEIPFREEDWGKMKARLAGPENPLVLGKWTKARWIGLGTVLLLGLFMGGKTLLELKSGDPEPLVPVEENVAEPEISLDDKQDKTGKSDSESGPSSLNSAAAILDVEGNTSSNRTVQTRSGRLQHSPIFLSEEGSARSVASNDRSRDFQFTHLISRSDSFLLSAPEFSSKGVEVGSVSKMDGMMPGNSKVKKWFAGRLNLSAQLAPDLSGVKLNQMGKAGQAVGLGVEYFLSPRFSINSGLFYSHKPYESEGPFEVSYGEQVNGVIGDCAILDIPLNLRFYPLEGRVQRAFVGVGLSSYLMLSETYEISYKDPGTGYDYTYTLEKKGENQHPFGIVNLSLGYERKLADRLSIQVEPYFKVPVDGIGEGNISLKSTGIFLGLKFYPGH
jgi:hypothetical protein